MKFLTAFTMVFFSFQLQAAAPGSAIGFELKTLDGDKVVSLSQFKGKVVYVDFWASWCGPCKQSLPELNKLYKTYKDLGFEIIAINLDENVEDAKGFLSEHPVDYTIVADPKGEIAEKFDVQAMPSSALIDQNGVLRINHKGFKMSDIKKLKKAVTLLLGES